MLLGIALVTAVVWGMCWAGRPRVLVGVSEQRAALVRALGPVRITEGRLVGFEYAPVKPLPKGWRTEEVAAAIRAILHEAELRPTPQALGNLAVVDFLFGRLDEAIAKLRTATEVEPKDASLWTNLSVFYARKASLAQDPRALEAAFQANERALQLRPNQPEVLFNRAWIVGSLGLPGAARQAWTKYLQDEEPTSLWAAEAHRRLEALNGRTLMETWDFKILNKQLSCGNLNDSRVASLLRESPALAFRWAVVSLLPGWAEAWQQKDLVLARRRLHATEIVANGLESEWNDDFLADVVSRLERISQVGPSMRLSRLSQGFVELARAIEEHERSRPGSALLHLNIAAAKFEGEVEALSGFVAYYESASLYAEGRYEDAESLLLELESAISGRQYPHLRGKVLHLLGLIHNVTGDPEGGRRCLLDALQIFDQLSEVEYGAYVNTLLGESYDELGDRDSAWRHFYKALSLARKLGFPYRDTQIYNALADFTLRSGDVRLSLLYQSAAVEASRLIDNPSFAADVLLWRAVLYARLWDPVAAEKDLRAASAQAKRIEDQARLAQFRGDLGLIYGILRLRDSPIEAFDSFDQAIKRYRETGHRPNLLLAYEARAQAAHMLGRAEQEKADLLQGLQMHQELGESLSDDGFRIALAGTVENAFDQIVRLEAVEEKDPNRALYFLERSRTLNWPVLWLGAGEASVSSRPLSSAAPLLGRNSVLVEYAILEDRLLIWVQTPKASEFHELLVKREQIQHLVDQFVNSDWGSSSWLNVSAKLYQFLLSSWFDANRFKEIIVIPDKDLYRLSFPVLLNPATRRFLVEEASVVLAPSATYLTYAGDRERVLASGPATGKILVVSNPVNQKSRGFYLPNLDRARREGQAIRRLFPNDTMLLEGSEAHVSGFISLLPFARWIHFSGHAVASSDRPLESYLLFAPSPADGDGTLTGREVQKLGFPVTMLVVLSSCNSAAGSPSSWAGAVSLARPFLTAGVPSVIGSLWPVGDEEARVLFTHFYSRLSEGVKPSSALHYAQLSVLHQQGLRSIRKNGWPAFQLFGVPGNITYRRHT